MSRPPWMKPKVGKFVCPMLLTGGYHTRTNDQSLFGETSTTG